MLLTQRLEILKYNWLMKKLEELKYAEFFINRLNKRAGFDYQVKLNEREKVENEFIDVYAYSKSGRYPELRLQIVTREGSLKKYLAQVHSIKKRAGEVIVEAQDMDTEEWIKNAIRNKERKYPSSIKRDIILIISGETGALLDSIYAKKIFIEFINSEFQGIYSVHLPILDSKISNVTHNGQIIAIKDILGEHGKSF